MIRAHVEGKLGLRARQRDRHILVGSSLEETRGTSCDRQGFVRGSFPVHFPIPLSLLRLLSRKLLSTSTQSQRDNFLTLHRSIEGTVPSSREYTQKCF